MNLSRELSTLVQKFKGTRKTENIPLSYGALKAWKESVDQSAQVLMPPDVMYIEREITGDELVAAFNTADDYDARIELIPAVPGKVIVPINFFAYVDGRNNDQTYEMPLGFAYANAPGVATDQPFDGYAYIGLITDNGSSNDTFITTPNVGSNNSQVYVEVESNANKGVWLCTNSSWAIYWVNFSARPNAGSHIYLKLAYIIVDA